MLCERRPARLLGAAQQRELALIEAKAQRAPPMHRLRAGLGHRPRGPAMRSTSVATNPLTVAGIVLSVRLSSMYSPSGSVPPGVGARLAAAATTIPSMTAAMTAANADNTNSPV